MKNQAIYKRDEKTLFLYDENGMEFIIQDMKLFLKKNGYPEKSSNYVDVDINGMFGYGENPRFKLIYMGAESGNFYFLARKIREGYITTQDDVIKEIGQLGIA